MSRTIFAPDTNFFIDNPDFVSFFASARSLIHMDIIWPVLRELDKHRGKRNDNRLELREKGRKAYDAIKLIRKLQDFPAVDIELEIYRPDGINPSLDPDTQIVDHVVRLATEKHSQDKIVFITSDDGLPTVLFIEEKKQRALTNVSVKTPEQVKKELRIYGNPSAAIEQISISRAPAKLGGKDGIEIFVDFTVFDLKRSKAWIAVHFIPHENQASSQANKMKYILNEVNVNSVRHTEKRHKLFLPYSLLNVFPKRQGMQHVTFVVSIWDAESRSLLAKEDSYRLDFALGSHYLTKRS